MQLRKRLPSLTALVALEAARRAERIGPRSYDRSRVALIDAIARLGLPTESVRKRRHADRASKDGSKRPRAKSAAERG